MEWNPPVLTIVILRHGSIVLGSTRGDKQEWKLNIEKKTARHRTIGHVQLYPTAPRLNVKPIAKCVYEAVRQGRGSNSDLISKGILVWKDDTIIIWHGKLIPGGGFARTVSGRRRKFRVIEFANGIDWLGTN